MAEEKRRRLIPLDTSSLVGSTLLGVAAALVFQITDRIDAMLWPGFFIFGGTTGVVFFGAGSVLFCLTNLIAGIINPAISLATASSPIAPFWIFGNTARIVVASILVWRIKPHTLKQYFMVLVPAEIVSNLVNQPLVAMAFGVPFPVMLLAIVVSSSTSLWGSVLTKALVDSLEKAGIKRSY